jgi:hypothetical protein
MILNRTLIILAISITTLLSAPHRIWAAGESDIGSANTISADPPVARPNTTPVIVPLFSDLTFADFNDKSFQYTPPANLSGPWAKVVFVGDFSCTAGRQFDRTTRITVGNTVIFFGTTAEPSKTVSPAWHVEKDLTDYSALFKSAQPGTVSLGNLVDLTYTGILHGSAHLEVYPADSVAPRVPDAVIPISNNDLATSTDTASAMLSLPTNIERAYLDLYAQSQGSDEFWYLNVPNDVASELQSGGGTAFREAEISIDGQAAGVAPIYPWIYTGGIDPYLWRPISGVQTLSFLAYRADLTPFAAVLSNGRPHTVGVSVFNANNYFHVSSALLLFLDHGKSHVTGAVTSNTLSTPSPVIDENVTAAGGTISTRSSRDFVIAGYVQTSHGKVDTNIAQKIDFSNQQKFTISASQYAQDLIQTTTLSSTTTTRDGFLVVQTQKELSYPLTVNYSSLTNADSSGTQTTTITQKYQSSERTTLNGFPLFYSWVLNQVAPSDTLVFDSTGTVTAKQGQKNSQQYLSGDTRGNFYSRFISAANGAITFDSAQ